MRVKDNVEGTLLETRKQRQRWRRGNEKEDINLGDFFLTSFLRKQNSENIERTLSKNKARNFPTTERMWVFRLKGQLNAQYNGCKKIQGTLCWNFRTMGAKNVLEFTEIKSKLHKKVKNQNGIRLEVTLEDRR